MPVIPSLSKSLHTPVDIATDYGLDDQEFGDRISVGSRFFVPTQSPDQLSGSSTLLSNGQGVGSFPEGKGAEA
jgi:hypothetical protein